MINLRTHGGSILAVAGTLVVGADVFARVGSKLCEESVHAGDDVERRWRLLSTPSGVGAAEAAHCIGWTHISSVVGHEAWRWAWVQVGVVLGALTSKAAHCCLAEVLTDWRVATHRQPVVV